MFGMQILLSIIFWKYFQKRSQCHWEKNQMDFYQSRLSHSNLEMKEQIGAAEV